MLQESTISSEDVAGQAKQVLTNLGAILKAAGSGFDHVVKTTVLLTDMADFKAVNEVYGEPWPKLLSCLFNTKAISP